MRKDESVLGIDMGSRTTKLVTLSRGRIESFEIFATNHNPMEKIYGVIGELKFPVVVATGYGRHLLKTRLPGNNKVITEIRACARGAKFVYPDCGTVIDIGGQDCKVIGVTEEGGFENFEMNDRCAAGCGKFLEVMADTLGYGVEEFGEEALTAEYPVAINSMCTVFAESEVVSLITSGEERKNIALGLHHSIVERVYTLVSKVKLKGGIILVGGVAKNRCILELLRKKLHRPILTPENPQIVSALGSALIGREILTQA